MIEVVHLGKRYGEIVAIDDVNFSVAKGEILAFLGPNGAGKTTTMRILTCFMPATSGTAKVAGFDIFESPMEVKRRIGYLPDNPPLYPEMTVSEYLQFVAKIKGVPNQRIKAALASALEKCNLGDVARRLIGNLSRGYRQRVGLAQAMIHNPDVLILDEPTVGLDPKQIIEIRELIKGLGGEHTIVLSTHILPEATAVSQKVVIINRGRIVAVDSQERLSAQVRKSEKISVRVRRGEAVDPEKIVSIEGVQQILPQPAQPSMNGEGVFIVESELGRDIREELSKRVVECGWGLLEMKPLAVSLEEVFLQLTTEEKGVEEAAAVPVAPGRVPA
ncbi:MAG: ATP-binding cassette domain-containing protein [Candidatus Manganitrophus sp.]|nr:ATP-binding cassette domain-containing protein [Candidatus Manganitrophus sp.]MDC4223754.1 ATP-binding cassette domain-containing protein [Candidatus Manganitrophus sp.]WDT69647.1 MAG: ATP-binding cassette domain-containing protein [Candidatus Manganitrophus sp.]